MSTSRIEQETIILFNEAEKTANIYTWNGALKRKLEKLAQECPECVSLSSSYRDGAVSYDVPKNYIRVNKPRVLSSSTREKMAKIARERFRRGPAEG